MLRLFRIIKHPTALRQKGSADTPWYPHLVAGWILRMPINCSNPARGTGSSSVILPCTSEAIDRQGEEGLRKCHPVRRRHGLILLTSEH
jgi:hypothetical protein